MIKHMKPLGFSLEEMRGLLETRDGLERDDLDPPTRLHLHGQLHMYGSAAQQKYTALREQLAIAENFVQRLGQDVRTPPRLIAAISAKLGRRKGEGKVAVCPWSC